MKALFDLTPWGLRRRIYAQADTLRAVHQRLDRIEIRLDAVEGTIRTTQADLDDLREARVAVAEGRLDSTEGALGAVTDEVTRLRDHVVPAVVGRSDALLERLAAEIEELGSLVERMLLDEPLPAPGASLIDEAKLSSALAEVQPALLEAFRGPEAEIRHRLDHYLEPLRANAPVLDLGCGRGELLLMLREAGVGALGIEGDAAVAQTAQRRGLEIIESDVLEGLRAQEAESRGAVTAIHLFEHLDAAVLLTVLAEIRRVLRPGGLLVVESPNPHSLRVGAALYWLDPTHERPLLPETLELYLKTAGFELARREYLHPFPDDQLFAADATPETGALAQRFDELVNGPRDFAVWASKPE